MRCVELFTYLEECPDAIVNVEDEDGHNENLSTDQLRDRIGDLNPDEPATFVFFGRLVLAESMTGDEIKVTSVKNMTV